LDGFMDAQPLNQSEIHARCCFKRRRRRRGAEQARRYTARYPVYGTIWNLFLVWIGAVEVEVCCVAVRPKNDILIGKFKPNISSDGQQPFSHILQAQTNLA
jgi:hypothetical protein